MNSENLLEQGFREWRKLGEISASMVPAADAGVLVIRDNALTGRAKGTDIIYIGSSKRLRKKIFAGLIGGGGGKNSQSLFKALTKDGGWDRAEISWVAMDKAKKKAAELLDKFQAKHGKCPPLNEL